MQTNEFYWYALYVKSRHEFVAQGELNKKGIEAYLPLISKVRQWKDRKKVINSPLFPGYVFVHIPSYPEAFTSVLRSRGAVTLISLKSCHPTPVPAEEMDSLRKFIESGKHIDVYPHLKEGKRVRIKKGLLSGAEGILEVKEDQYVFVVNIDILGRSIGVKVYAEDLEAA